MTNDLIFNPIWMPTADLARVFLVKSPHPVDQIQIVESLLPIRYENLAREFLSQREPIWLLSDRLDYFHIHGSPNPENIVEAIMNCNSFQCAKHIFYNIEKDHDLQLHFPLGMTYENAEYIYDETSLLMLAESLYSIYIT